MYPLLGRDEKDISPCDFFSEVQKPSVIMRKHWTNQTEMHSSKCQYSIMTWILQEIKNKKLSQIWREMRRHGDQIQCDILNWILKKKEKRTLLEKLVKSEYSE